MRIENRKFITFLETVNTERGLIDKYITELDKVNELIAVIENSHIADEKNEELTRSVNVIRRTLEEIKSNTVYIQENQGKLNTIKNNTAVIKEIATEVFLRSGDFIEYIKSKRARDTAIDTLKKEKREIDKQITNLRDSLENVESTIENKSNTAIATEISNRVSDLKYKEDPNDATEESAQFWAKKRSAALRVIGVSLFLITISFIIIFWKFKEITNEQIYAISALKVTVLAILYSRYYFAQKNYRIYADLLAKYKHLELNAQILENYLMLPNIDKDLKSQLILKVTNLISAPISPHHFKDTDNKSIINNMIPTDLFKVSNV